MLTDLLIVALTVAIGTWGYTQGVSVPILVALGFGIGALLGSRIGPQVLDGGLRDPLAPALALPGALLLGGATAAALERLGDEVRRRYLRRRYTLDAVAGAALGACLGVVLVWIAGAIAARVDGLDHTARGSEIVSQLNSMLPPPGPLVSANGEYALPVTDGPRGRHPVKDDPQVREAARSVVRITARGCEGRGSGSGWVAASGIVVTNAHVIHESRGLEVQVQGGGARHEAIPILYDKRDDISVLRVPGVQGVPPLRIRGNGKVNESIAVLGFPFGRRYKTRPARMGITARQPTFRSTFGRIYVSLISRLRADIGHGPGSSGGPIVDRGGRVVAMIFGGRDREGGKSLYAAVPASSIKRDLRRALASPQSVDTGDCEDS